MHAGNTGLIYVHTWGYFIIPLHRMHIFLLSKRITCMKQGRHLVGDSMVIIMQMYNNLTVVISSTVCPNGHPYYVGEVMVKIIAVYLDTYVHSNMIVNAIVYKPSGRAQLPHMWC